MLVAWAAHLEENPAEPPPAAGGAADAHFGAEVCEEGANPNPNPNANPNSNPSPNPNPNPTPNPNQAGDGAAVSMLREATARLERSGRAAVTLTP